MKNENEQYEFGWDPEKEKRSERIRKRLPNEEHLEAAILEGEAAIRSAEERPQKGSYGREDAF